jgi:hypothetical protein
MKIFVRNNKSLVAIFLFLTVFGLFQMAKPSFMYSADGSIRDFGIGYKNKTILPVWLFSIILGIMSYVSVSVYAIL